MKQMKQNLLSCLKEKKVTNLIGFLSLLEIKSNVEKYAEIQSSKSAVLKNGGIVLEVFLAGVIALVIVDAVHASQMLTEQQSNCSLH